MTKVAVLGAGNIGHALAGLLGANPSLQVFCWGPRLNNQTEINLRVYGQDGTYAIGLAKAEPSIYRAVSNADIVILAVPTNARRRILEKIRSLLCDCALLVAWEGTGWFREDLIELDLAGLTAVGLQRSPILSRVREVGRSVEILGVRSEVVAAATNDARRSRAGVMLRAILPFKFTMAPTYSCVSLSSGNPLIHPARLYGCHKNGESLMEVGLAFYGDWDDVASTILLDLHHELATLRDALLLPRRYLRTLADRRVVQTPSQVTNDIVSEECLHEIRVPVRRNARGVSLDREHRFFLEDIGEGLAHILAVAHQVGIAMPVARDINDWYAGPNKHNRRPALLDNATHSSLR